MRRLQHLVEDLPPATADRLVAAAIAVLTLAGVLFDPRVRAPLAVAGAIAIAGAVTCRRDRPGLALAVAVAAQAADAVLGGHLAVSTATLPAMLVLSYSLGRHAAPRELAAGLALLVGASLCDAALAADGFLNELAFDLLVATALPVTGGRVLRRRAELVAELHRQRGQLERERDQRVRDAAVAERVRIARELHDVVVHDVSAMVVQATAARLAVHRQPSDAVAAIRRVEGAGREALDELRRALGVLRTDDHALALEPQPSLARLPALVETAAATGVDLDLDVEPGLDRLPSDLQLAAYRIVQDVLADPGTGPGSVRVRLGCVDAVVVVEITGPGSPPDRDGLLAARQRVALFDGTLDAGPGDAGGSRVCAILPVPVSVP